MDGRYFWAKLAAGILVAHGRVIDVGTARHAIHV